MLPPLAVEALVSGFAWMRLVCHQDTMAGGSCTWEAFAGRTEKPGRSVLREGSGQRHQYHEAPARLPPPGELSSQGSPRAPELALCPWGAERRPCPPPRAGGRTPARSLPARMPQKWPRGSDTRCAGLAALLPSPATFTAPWGDPNGPGPEAGPVKDLQVSDDTTSGNRTA